MHTLSLIGLTSSLDSLLDATTQAKLSECSHKETNPNLYIEAPVSDQHLQETTASEHVQIKSSATNHAGYQPIPLPNSSHKEQVKDDSSHISNTTYHSENINKTSLAKISLQKSIDHDTVVQDKSSYVVGEQTLTYSDSSRQEHSTEDQAVVLSGHQTASVNMPTVPSIANEPLQVMLRCNDKLIAALSLDPQGIAGILLAKGLIPANTEAQVRQCSTSREKATILVTVIRQRIEVAPKRFHEFLNILSEIAWTKDILEVLQSSGGVPHKTDIHLQLSSDDHSPSESKSATPGSDESSINEEYTIPTLNSDDEAELEAQLSTDAENMRTKFAALLWKTTESFKHQRITPRSLINGVFALTEYDDPSVGKPLLEREKEALTNAQSIDTIFDILRPHMTFFNYEILQFLIETIGSMKDKRALKVYLRDFQYFCRRSVFEVTKSVLGHSIEKAVGQQYFHVKITKAFKSAFLCECTTEPGFSSEKICAPELGISLNNAKYVQRKLATVLKLKVSSIYLDSVSPGSTILTFLLPSEVSLADLDSDPNIIALSFSGIHILCGPPGKPEPKELTSNGLIVQWSQPEYGRPSLVKYILHYQKKCSQTKQSEWKELELSSLETHTCVPDLNDRDKYAFKICTVSDVGTQQYSNESDSIVIYADGILTNNIHKVIVANKDTLTSAFSSSDPNTIAVMLSNMRVISEEDEAQITLASTPSEKATILITAIQNQVKRAPEKLQDFLNVLSEAKLSLPGDIVETLWSEYYDSVYKQYLDYLKFLYASLDKKQTLSDQWPPSATKKFFRLAMIKTTEVQRGHIDDRYIRMTITGKVDDILHEKYPIQLEDIFKETECQRHVTEENEGQRKVILLEGAPGCGKSTLSVYICQQWEKGELFNQFELILLIRLRDPAVNNAKGLADLLPCPDTTTAQQIAARMLTNKCRDFLFILDGWDELPPNLRKNSIFHQLVQPELPWSNPLRDSTVIVTSRPIASGDLHQVVSSRVEILGFTAEELDHFFTECLKGDTEAVKTLLERIEENPEIAGSCYLPLNATILVHLFKSDRNTLPTTLYGIFSSLVLNCIKRHLKLRTQCDESIESLDQLPEFMKSAFLILCQLAYDGVIEDKIIFTSLPPDISTLSLLQGVQSFIGREKAVSHNFIHLSIQELLAAWYISTQLSASEQVSKFNELLDKSRFSAVFRFYAAITKLKTPGINDVVKNMVNKYSSRSNPLQADKVLMVSLLHCLYEAQDSSLCVSVAQQLQARLELNLSITTLTPSDCLCIGYFLAQICKVAAGEFVVDLYNCSIGDEGCKYLVSGLHKFLDTHSVVTTLLSITMNENSISHLGLHHLLTLLKIGCISVLNLRDNGLISKQDAIYGSLAEVLKNNTTLIQLWLPECNLNSRSVESLAEALTSNKHLERLNIGENALCDDGIQHLAHALRVNQGLKYLFLNSCGITDMGLECLARSLQHNIVLNELSVYNDFNARKPNRLTEWIIPVLTECLQNNHTLTKLVLPKNLASSTTNIEKAVNDVRKWSGLPLIKVSGMSRFEPLNENNNYVASKITNTIYSCYSLVRYFI